MKKRNRTPLQELYRGREGSLYAIQRFSKNQMFFRYRKLSQEEIRQLTDHSDNTKRESKAGSIGDKTSEPADKLRADTTSGSSLGVMLHG